MIGGDETPHDLLLLAQRRYQDRKALELRGVYTSKVCCAVGHSKEVRFPVLALNQIREVLGQNQLAVSPNGEDVVLMNALG